MRQHARVKGQAEIVALLIGGIVLTIGALIGFMLGFARPLPATAWAGFGVVLAVAGALAVVAVLIVTRDRPAAGPAVRPAARDRTVRRILVLANEAIGSEKLRSEVCEQAAGRETEVVVVAPALCTPLQHWASADDGPRAEARRRLQQEIEILSGLGVRARGEVGVDDPLQAVADALRSFPAAEIIISTHPIDRANWLEEGVAGRVRERYQLPVTHVIAEA